MPQKLIPNHHTINSKQLLKKRVIAEYDSRNLKSDVRYSTLKKIDTFLKEQYFSMSEDVKSLPADKNDVKDAYRKYKGAEPNSAESSVINEIYNQVGM